MAHQKLLGHSQYEITDTIREKYAVQTKKWEMLLEDAGNPIKKGCFTCQYYTPRDNGAGFIDVQMVDGHPLPWDTEDAWVWCDKNMEIDIPLKINCSDWKKYMPTRKTG